MIKIIKKQNMNYQWGIYYYNQDGDIKTGKGKAGSRTSNRILPTIPDL